MRITDIEAVVLRQENLSTDRADSSQDALIIKVHTDEGIVGYGEVDSFPEVAKAIVYAPKVLKYCTGLKELLLGEDPLEIKRLWDVMYHGTLKLGGRGAAIQAMSGIDMALWDIKGKYLHLPIYRLIGGCFKESIAAYSSVLFPSTTEEVGEVVLKAKEEGFSAIKFGWGKFGNDPQEDEALIATAREAAGADMEIMVDCGNCYQSYHAAYRAAKMLQKYNIFFMEEPFWSDDLTWYAKLSSRTDLCIATGEKLTTRFQFQDLMINGKVDIVQPDIARVGGITEALNIAFLAEMNKTLFIPHAWSTDIVIAAALHVNASIKNSLFMEYCMEETPLRRMTTVDPITMKEGVIQVPQKPGLGIELNEEEIKRYIVS